MRRCLRLSLNAATGSAVYKEVLETEVLPWVKKKIVMLNPHDATLHHETGASVDQDGSFNTAKRDTVPCFLGHCCIVRIDIKISLRVPTGRSAGTHGKYCADPKIFGPHSHQIWTPLISAYDRTLKNRLAIHVIVTQMSWRLQWTAHGGR